MSAIIHIIFRLISHFIVGGSPSLLINGCDYFLSRRQSRSRHSFWHLSVKLYAWRVGERLILAMMLQNELYFYPAWIFLFSMTFCILEVCCCLWNSKRNLLCLVLQRELTSVWRICCQNCNCKPSSKNQMQLILTDILQQITVMSV